MSVTLDPRLGDAAPTVVTSGSGGWALHVVCAVCPTEAIYKGVVICLAADAAVRDGWSLDYADLHLGAYDRVALCPQHAGQDR